MSATRGATCAVAGVMSAADTAATGFDAADADAPAAGFDAADADAPATGFDAADAGTATTGVDAELASPAGIAPREARNCARLICAGAGLSADGADADSAALFGDTRSSADADCGAASGIGATCAVQAAPSHHLMRPGCDASAYQPG